MAQVFDGITVLDFTSGRAGGVATMVMSDFGAEVIKVEPPGGERFRNSLGSIQWNRGKKSVVLDLKTTDGQDKARGLAHLSDVVVENFRPGVTQRLGIDYDSLQTGHPELVYATLTSFGPRGPYANYKGYDGVVAAKSGRMMMFANQNPREGPNYVVTQGVCHAAATALVRGITSALYVRERTGRGQRVETSMLKAVTTYDHISWVHGQMVESRPDEYPPDPRVGTGRGNPTGYLPARTKDGRWIQLGNVVERLFRSMMHSMDMGLHLRGPAPKERSLPGPGSRCSAGAYHAGESPGEDPGRVDGHIPEQRGQRRRGALPHLRASPRSSPDSAQRQRAGDGCSWRGPHATAWPHREHERHPGQHPRPCPRRWASTPRRSSPASRMASRSIPTEPRIRCPSIPWKE